MLLLGLWTRRVFLCLALLLAAGVLHSVLHLEARTLPPRLRRRADVRLAVSPASWSPAQAGWRGAAFPGRSLWRERAGAAGRAGAGAREEVREGTWSPSHFHANADGLQAVGTVRHGTQILRPHPGSLRRNVSIHEGCLPRGQDRVWGAFVHFLPLNVPPWCAKQAIPACVTL